MERRPGRNNMDYASSGSHIIDPDCKLGIEVIADAVCVFKLSNCHQKWTGRYSTRLTNTFVP